MFTAEVIETCLAGLVRLLSNRDGEYYICTCRLYLENLSVYDVEMFTAEVIETCLAGLVRLLSNRDGEY
jgi:hypothetical protein